LQINKLSVLCEFECLQVHTYNTRKTKSSHKLAKLSYNVTNFWELVMPVPVRELKANLSEVLSRAQSGEVIEVTSHNKPIARITGIQAADTHPLGELAADESVTWNGKKP